MIWVMVALVIGYVLGSLSLPSITYTADAKQFYRLENQIKYLRYKLKTVRTYNSNNDPIIDQLCSETPLDLPHQFGVAAAKGLYDDNQT